MSNRLRPFRADRLREAPLTYVDVGATLGELPAGYHHVVHTSVVGRGRTAFDAVARSLMHWELQRGAGVRVVASSETVEVDAVAVLGLGWGPLALRAPVRVVLVVEEADRRGFAYGTLPGHPESGEELFVVEQGADGTVTLRITAFSRPRSILARCAGPVGRLAQRWMTRRYGRALTS